MPKIKLSLSDIEFMIIKRREIIKIREDLIKELKPLIESAIKNKTHIDERTELMINEKNFYCEVEKKLTDLLTYIQNYLKS